VVTVHPGTTLDPTAAQTHLFLAYSDNATFERAAAGMSPVERARLESEVHTARQRGFAFVRHDGGSFGLAAPVFGEHGLAATVAVLGAGDLTDLSSPHSHLQATATALGDDLKTPGVSG
jgi:DNA-binding IclR family transcriptional regulator